MKKSNSGSASETPASASESPGPESTQWLEFLNLGWIFAGTMTLTVGGGVWLDHRMGTAPILLLIGIFLGFGGCGYSLYRVIQKLNRGEEKKPPK